jgi:hypothetical protein
MHCSWRINDTVLLKKTFDPPYLSLDSPYNYVVHYYCTALQYFILYNICGNFSML